LLPQRASVTRFESHTKKTACRIVNRADAGWEGGALARRVLEVEVSVPEAVKGVYRDTLTIHFANASAKTFNVTIGGEFSN
jgi:hypothetical protein